MVDYYEIKKAIADLFKIQKDDELGTGDLIIKSRDGELLAKISDEEIRKAYEDAAKIKGSQFFSSTGRYAEVAVQPDGRFSRNEEVEVEDNVNGVSYRLGSASLEYCIYVINMICESEEIDYHRTIHDFRMTFNIASRRAVFENNFDFKRILPRTLRLTSLKMQFDNETSLAQIKKYASAFEYLFMYKRGYALFEVSNISTLLRMEGGRQI